MKIIQSLWSKPLFNISDNRINERYIGGWLDFRFFLMSWTLSCLRLKEFYSDIELITDKTGQEILIQELGLPYKTVNTSLNSINHYSSKLWAIGKIFSYSLQKEPFLHVDGDVYIWKKFPNKFLDARLIAQNFELHELNYKENLSIIIPEFNEIPKAIREGYEKGDLRAVNAGILGGTDIRFFQYYSSEAIKFIDSNIDKLDKINIGLFNMLYEQYLFCSGALNHGIPVTCMFQNLGEHYEEILKFNLVPNSISYIHVVGKAKRDLKACRQVEKRLQYEYPKYFNRIQKYLDKKKGLKTHKLKSKNEEPKINQNRMSLLKRLKNKEFHFSVDIENQSELSKKVSTEIRNVVLEEKQFKKRKKPFQDSKKLKNYNKRIFDFFYQNSPTSILDKALILSDYIKLIKTSWYLPSDKLEFLLNSNNQQKKSQFLIEGSGNYILMFFYQPDLNGSNIFFYERILQPWEEILMMFQSPTKGSELLNSIAETNNYDKNSFHEIKEALVNYISSWMIYENCLDFA